jgi:hypothetical protein
MSNQSPILLPSKKSPAETDEPRTIVLFGPPKVGKTSSAAALDNCLLLDLEKGARFVESMKIEVDTIKHLYDIITELAKVPGKYDFIALDSLDYLEDWLSDLTCRVAKVKHISDIPFGAGYAEVKQRMLSIMTALSTYASRCGIFIGHRKQSIIGSDKLEFTSETLDLTGKLKNAITAKADLTGYLFRNKDDENKLYVSFNAGDVESGSRIEKVAGKVEPFSWNLIFNNL